MGPGLDEGEVSLDTSRVGSLTYSCGEDIEAFYLLFYKKLDIKRLPRNPSEDALIQQHPVRSWTSLERHKDLRTY